MGSGFRVKSLGFRFQGLGFRVEGENGLWLRVEEYGEHKV